MLLHFALCSLTFSVLHAAVVACGVIVTASLRTLRASNGVISTAFQAVSATIMPTTNALLKQTMIVKVTTSNCDCNCAPC